MRRISLAAVAAVLVTTLQGPGAVGASKASAWRLVASPSVPGVGQRLTSVTSVSASDAWAVGDVYDQTAGEEETLALHWDGVRWSTVRSPSVPKVYNTLTSVAALSSSDVWAV